MADWAIISLVWKGRSPDQETLDFLNRILKEVVDDDFPELKREGLDTRGWRAPVDTLPEILNLLHCLGAPCSGRLTMDNDNEDDQVLHQRASWIDSAREIPEKFKHMTIWRPVPSRFERDVLDDES